MAGTNGTGAEQLTGRVEAVNEKGLRLEGRDGWLNFSKWAEAIGAPAVGGLVTVTLDKAGFVRTVAPAEASDHHRGDAAGRETAITRLAVLKAAAEWSAGRAEVKSADVLKIAERWERWVLQEGDA
jgi:hypothetical protein